MRGGYSLAKMVVEPVEEVSSNPLDDFGSWILYRFAEPMGVKEFVEIIPEVNYAKIEKGPAELKLFGGINDELPAVAEILGGLQVLSASQNQGNQKSSVGEEFEPVQFVFLHPAQIRESQQLGVDGNLGDELYFIFSC